MGRSVKGCCCRPCRSQCTWVMVGAAATSCDVWDYAAMQEGFETPKLGGIQGGVLLAGWWHCLCVHVNLWVL